VVIHLQGRKWKCVNYRAAIKAPIAARFFALYKFTFIVLERIINYLIWLTIRFPADIYLQGRKGNV